LPTVFWIAWRNLVARNRRAGLSFMTLVSIAGVAIGVAALIVVLSVMGGFEQDLRNKMLRGQPHLEVLNKESGVVGFSLKETPVEAFRSAFPEATDIEPFTQADVVMKQGRHLTSAVIFGVEPERDEHLWGFSGAMTEGDMSSIGRLHPPANADEDNAVERPGILLGEQLAEQLGADLGDEIIVLSPQANVGSTLSGGTVSRQYVVSGKFRTGLFNYDTKWAVVSLGEGRKFMPDYDYSLDDDEYVTGVAVNVRDPMKIREIVARVFPAAGADLPKNVAAPLANANLDPLTWEKANKSLLFALKLEKFAMGSILMLIVIVAGFSISGTMMMTVFHRRGQVSLLRSLGMSRRDVNKLFLSQGFTIGTVGILAGLVLGIAICLLIKSFQFIQLPAGVYHLKFLPCKWLWFDYAVICLTAWCFSLVASTYPAFTAARQDPGQGLRYL
jgi:lipoprotein-releasing system permease protein